VIVIALFGVYAGADCARPSGRLTDFGRLLALGITAMVLCQALINFAVVLGMVPDDGGIPLPFVSVPAGRFARDALATWRAAKYFAAGEEPHGDRPWQVGARHSSASLGQGCALLGRSVERVKL